MRNRRQFLKASGLCLTLPLLESDGLSRVSGREGVKRLVTIGTYLGFHTPSWFPKETGRGYTQSPVLAPLV